MSSGESEAGMSDDDVKLLIDTKTGLIFNNPRTTRAAYRQLKRNNRRS